MSRIVNKRIIICLMSLVMGLVMAATALVAYAYFSKKDIYDGYISGQVELLFDRLSEDGMTAYGEAEGIVADPEAEWGSEANPYVISNVRHFYNLSELQNLGYFARKHLSKNTETDLTHLPYFLICTPDYTPVLIDGSHFRAISAIGSDKYPFIGSVKGVTGSPTVTVGANTCDTSVLHGVSVKGNPANADAGLFGHVGFLGTPPAAGSEDTTFLGTPSVISNMVLSDVTVSVDSSLWDAVLEFIVDIALDAAGHRYSFTDLYDSADTSVYDSVPHENHHIGILAGHVSYSTVEYVSVFYSSGDVVAMDLSDTTKIDGTEANYLSAAGIMGFIYNLNPSYDEGTGEITAGSGDSIGDLSYSMVGGGGLQSGTQAGYVLASNMYTAYGYTAADTPIEDGASLNISKATDKNGNALCHEWIRDNIFGLGTTATGEYYFYDGVFTFALSTQNDVIDSTWGDEVPEFSIGENSADAWHTNNLKGQKSVSAYIRQLTNDRALQDAILSGKPLVIMKELDDKTSAFMMSLYQKSSDVDSGNFESRYNTGGTQRYYATKDEVQALIDSYTGSPEEFIAGFEAGTTAEEVDRILKAIVNNEDDEIWKVIDLDATSGDLTPEEQAALVAELRNTYRIKSTYIDDNTYDSYSYFSGMTPVTVGAAGINDYYDYGKNTQGLQGYFYYTVQRSFIFPRYTYYWQSLDGTVDVIVEDSYTGPDNYFKKQTGNWNGENIYSAAGYTGVVVNEGKFYGTNNAALANGQHLHKLTGSTVSYFFSPLGDENCYYMTDLDMKTPIKEADLEETGNSSSAGLPYYTYTVGGNTYTGVLVDRYYIYNFYSDSENAADTSDDNYLRMIKAVYGWLGTKYTLWNGPDSLANSSTFAMSWPNNNPSVTYSTNATVRFNSDGTCYIQYGIDSVSQFVNYNDSKFNTAQSPSDSTALCIYVIENTQALDYGRITFDPNAETDSHTFRADEYVFWPESASVDVAAAGTKSSVTEGVTTQFSVLSLQSLAWNNGNASDNEGKLHGGNLTKKFHMIDGISFGATIDIGGSLGTDGFIRAPVGTAGTETDIPTGCVAFRVNKTSTEPQKIRVIVAVPTCDLYEGEDGYDLGDYTRYFCLWEMNEAGSTWLQMFSASDYIERFEIPRSHPYRPGTSASSDTSEYVTATYDGAEYRSYLNGDRVLVAYEFKVYNEGVYVLGTSTSTSDESFFADKDVAPMEIVYFSADGVASSGRDGLSGSQLGSVDYVYSYKNNIVTVTESSSADSSGKEDYSTFYPSYCILYMNSVADAATSTFVNVNSEKVYIRRYITDEDPPTSSGGYVTTTSKATVAFTLERDKYTRLSQYSRLADNVKEEE